MSTKYRKQFVSRLLAAILIIGPALSLFSSRSQASDWESSNVTIKGVSTLRFSLPKQDKAMFSRQNVPPVDVVDLENNMIYTDREPFVLVERSIDYYNWDNYYYAPVGHLKINIWLLKAPGQCDGSDMNSLKKEIDSGLHRAYDELNLKNPEYSLAGGKEYAMRVNFPTTYDVISMAGAEWVRYYLTGQFEVTTYVTPLTKTDCLSIEFNFTNNAYDEKYERKWKAAAQADLEKVLSSIRLTPNPAQSPAGSGK